MHTPQVGETVDVYEDDVWWWAVVTEVLPNAVRVSRLGTLSLGLCAFLSCLSITMQCVVQAGTIVSVHCTASLSIFFMWLNRARHCVFSSRLIGVKAVRLLPGSCFGLQ